MLVHSLERLTRRLILDRQLRAICRLWKENGQQDFVATLVALVKLWLTDVGATGVAHARERLAWRGMANSFDE